MDLAKASLIQFIMECESGNHGHWQQQADANEKIDIFVLTGPQIKSWFARKYDKHLQVYLPDSMYWWASKLPCAGILISHDSFNICYLITTDNGDRHKLYIRLPIPSERIKMINNCETVQFAKTPNISNEYEQETTSDKYISCEYEERCNAKA